MSSPNSLDAALLGRVLQRTASADAIEQLCQPYRKQFRHGIYTVAAVVWLMIYQRLNSKRTLSSAVHWLALHASSWRGSKACKRVLEGRISTRTGGYCQARQKVPTLVISQVTDHIFEQLQAQIREELPEI